MHNTAETSVNSYIELKESGKLTRRQAEVMEYMKTVKSVTRRNIAKGLDWDTGSAAGRVNELVAMKRLDEVGSEKCPKTGKTVGLVRLPKSEYQLSLI